MSEIATIFINLQKQMYGFVWILFPTIVVLKVLLMSVSLNSSAISIINLIKSALISYFILTIFQYFYPEFLEMLDEYIYIATPTSSKSVDISFWRLSVEMMIGYIAVLAHTVNASLVLLLLTVVTVGFPISFILFSVLEFDGPWKIVIKCFLGVIIWAFTMYLVRNETNIAEVINEKNAADYFANSLGASFCSFFTTLLSFKFNTAVNAIKNKTDRYIDQYIKNIEKDNIRSGLHTGSMTINPVTNEATLKNTIVDPNKEAVHEYRMSHLRHSNGNNGRGQGHNQKSSLYDSFGIKRQKISSAIEMFSPTNISNDNKSDVDKTPTLEYRRINDIEQATSGYEITTENDKFISFKGANLMKNEKGNYYDVNNNKSIPDTDTLVVNGEKYLRNYGIDYTYFNHENSSYVKNKPNEDQQWLDLN